MRRQRTIIIGAGLAGLWAARQLEREGHDDCLVLEARNDMGGRIRTVRLPTSDEATAGYDLGASWYWPELQPALARVIRDLRLPVFPQHDSGAMLVERSGNGQPQRFAGFASAPASMRLVGGMRALAEAVAGEISSTRVCCGQRVRHVAVDGTVVTVVSEGPNDALERHHANQVLLALPPRLAVQSIEFNPPLPEPLQHAWQATPTWMASHAKYVAAYDRPFWRDAGLSGQARSERGPLAEIHDASSLDGAAALFGFVGVPAASRQRISADDLQGCVAIVAPRRQMAVDVDRFQ